jgi:signal transduction histidine kinase
MNAQQYTERWQHAQTLLQRLPDNYLSSEAAQEIRKILDELRVYQVELEAQNYKLRKLQQTLDKERQRIAHHLYDAVNQSLFSARIIGETMRETLPLYANGELSSLNHLNASIRRAIAELRVLSLELRPEQLLATPLEILLRQLTYILDEADVMVNCDLMDMLSDDVKIAIYRMAQEALTNIYQHAQADEVRIELSQNGKAIRFHIRDNGVGFDTGNIRPASGLEAGER